MRQEYVMDACALLRFLRKEPGFDTMEKILTDAMDGKIVIYMSAYNYLEVYYDSYRVSGEENANQEFDEVFRELPIRLLWSLAGPYQTFFWAGHLKASYRISLADAVAGGLALALGATLITSDREFVPVEAGENIKIQWI